MSYRDLQPLPPDIAALLGAERRAPRPSAAHQAAIYARIEAAVGTTGSAPEPGASGRVTGLARGTAVTNGIATAAGSKALLATVALVAGGVGAGVAGYLAWRVPHRSPPIAIPAGPNVGSRLTLPSVVPLPLEPTTPIAQPPAAVDEKTRAAAADLAAESALLEHARQALERGAVEVALGDVKQHARRFAEGHLIEEREALWIKALCASGRGNAARARAAWFRKHFPHSIQREAIDRAIRELP